MPLSYVAYAAGLVAMPLATGSILSMGRFMSVSVPHFLALAFILQGRPRSLWAVVSAFAICQFLLAQGLLSWYLVG